jgi:hypothetical protein
VTGAGVPAEFTAYFTAAAAASGVLIGLLFVAVSLRPETVFGEVASAVGRAHAGSAFTALVNCFFVSMVALIPQAGLGVAAIILAVSSLLNTATLHREVARQELHLTMLVLGVLTYLVELAFGILLIPHEQSISRIENVAYLQIALFSVALSRAWTLVQGKHLPAAEPVSSASTEISPPQPPR